MILISIVIPMSDGEKLWFQDRKGKLEFPGGKVEGNELPDQAAVREAQEEVGVSLNVNDLQFFKDYTFHYKNISVRIFAYIFNDLEAIFPQKGYLAKNEWLNGEHFGQNQKIIDDIVKYFQ